VSAASQPVPEPLEPPQLPPEELPQSPNEPDKPVKMNQLTLLPKSVFNNPFSPILILCYS